MNDNFKDIENFLYALRNAGSKYSLDRMRKIASLMGNPEKSYPIIHVAGTNGKGSVSAMLDAIVRQGGFSTGLFTSPHLVFLGERIQVDRKPISKDEIIYEIGNLQNLIDANFDKTDFANYPSFFEYMTALALLTFKKNDVDCAVLEVGLGGTLDSTNIVDSTISVITSIGLDHTQILGNTIADIAFQKAGIIKEGTPVVCGWLPEEAMEVVRRVAKEKSAPLYCAQDYYPSDEVLPTTSLFGYFQRRNAALATLCVKILRNMAQNSIASPIFKTLSDGLIKSALNNVQWAARWQTLNLKNGARLILDSSHNEEGAKTLESNLEELSKEPNAKKPIVVVGVLGRERAIPLFKVIAKYAREIILLVPNQPRALNFEELKDCIGQCCVPIKELEIDEVFGEGFDCKVVASGETVVCTGSIYLAGEVLAKLQGTEPDGLQDRPYPKKS